MDSRRPAGPKRNASVHSSSRPAQKKTAGKPRRRMRAWVKIVLSLFLAVCIGGVVIASSMGVYALRFVNGDAALNLEYYKTNQNQTTIIYGKDKNGKDVEITRLHGTENRIWIDLDKMSPYMKQAFIALEDKRFEKHSGVDWIRTIGVMVKPSAFGQGGSTITQQLIKNLTGDKDVTIVRKFNEILSALNMERHYSKDQIIEAYLNTLYLSEGCYGVQTAAQTYFGKDVKDLNLAECASIAAITQYPTKYDPLINPENNKKRQKDCLKLMLDQGKINQQQYDEAVAYPLVFTNSKDYKGSTAKAGTNEKKDEKVESYYTDYVMNQVINDLMEKYGYSRTYARKMMYGGGLRIYSAVDFEVQQAMENIYYNRSTRGFPNQSGSKVKVQSAMTVLEYDGRIAGMVGGAGKKTGNLVLNRAADSPRQPGSSIKPISVYAPALEVNQINWSSLYPDKASSIVNGKQWPKNYEGYGNGQMTTVQHAIAVSKNTIPVRILQGFGSNNAGLKRSYDFLVNKLGLSNLVPSGSVNDMNYSALALGGMAHGSTTLEMSAAFQIFNNGGKYNEPYCYYKVTDASGSKVLLQHTQSSKQVISEETSVVMNKLLQTVVNDSDGTARQIRGNYPAFGKTGTTTDNKDYWLVGGTPKYVAAVWYGYDKNDGPSINSTYTKKIWKAVMDDIYKNKGLSTTDKFYETPGVVEKKYCTVTGLLAGETCPSASGWYKISALPETCTQVHQGVAPQTTEPVSGEAPQTTEAQPAIPEAGA